MTNMEEMKFRGHIIPKTAKVTKDIPCLFTISVNPAKQDINDLVDAFYWAKQYYNMQGLLMGDSLYQITLKITKGLSDSNAFKQSVISGKTLLKEFLSKIEEPEITIFKTSDILQKEEFSSAYQDIQRLYNNDTLFQDAIISDATFFVGRQEKNNNLDIPKSDAIVLSISYLIQEIAVYLVMAEDSWLNDVYLGNELPTLAKIMNNEIPNAPKALKQRICIECHKRVKNIES
jgi:tRNA-dependent cyclodipeptide synthase